MKELSGAYAVKQFIPRGRAEVDVPASKSVLSRALILAAFSGGDVRVGCGALCEDIRALIGCLGALGIPVEEEEGGLLVRGRGGILNRTASLDVGSAGTAARFLPAVLAALGGDYRFTASEQMSRRPMEILPLLAEAGARVEGTGFPFRLVSDGIAKDRIAVGTETSSQFASALLLAAGLSPSSFAVDITGSRARGSYVALTLKMLEEFGFCARETDRGILVRPLRRPPSYYEAESDFSAACYFFALALLCRAEILVRNVSLSTAQGDVAFLKLLMARGLDVHETDDGLLADGRKVASFLGFDEDFQNFADQALTAAALAPFAATPTRIRNVAHIRRQECDRIGAILTNLAALGVHAESDGRDIWIEPAASLRPARIATYADHRVAMAFSLVGLKTGAAVIDDPACTNKTFEGYFDLLDKLTE